MTYINKHRLINHYSIFDKIIKNRINLIIKSYYLKYKIKYLYFLIPFLFPIINNTTPQKTIIINTIIIFNSLFILNHKSQIFSHLKIISPSLFIKIYPLPFLLHFLTLFHYTSIIIFSYIFQHYLIKIAYIQSIDKYHYRSLFTFFAILGKMSF